MEWVGTQATELLIAVHWSLGAAEIEAEVALAPEERPVRMSLDSSTTLVKRNRGTDLNHCWFCGPDRRDLLWHPGVAERMSILGWAVGLLEAATVYRDYLQQG